MPPSFKLVWENFGLAGLFGMVVGWALLSTGVKGGNRNIFGQEPWHPIVGAAIGGLVIGFAAYFFYGFFGFSAATSGTYPPN